MISQGRGRRENQGKQTKMEENGDYSEETGAKLPERLVVNGRLDQWVKKVGRSEPYTSKSNR